uniref:PAR1 protein n=1 Tax=Picea sitchensis TaxID=3332 RepID=A9P2D3_PICSI|nr:unknown [Picea sitchensis]
MASTKPIHAAPSPSCIFSLLIILMAITVPGVQSAIIKCEELPAELCAFSISSSGNRCVLEKDLMMDGTLQFQCQSSVVSVEKLVEWIESEECINACGLERMAVGMSTDSLLEPEFSAKLCSSECRNNCPNIVDLYVNLAAGEGISLSSMCASHKNRSRKVIKESESKSKSGIHSKSSDRMATTKQNQKLL